MLGDLGGSIIVLVSLPFSAAQLFLILFRISLCSLWLFVLEVIGVHLRLSAIPLLVFLAALASLRLTQDRLGG